MTIQDAMQLIDREVAAGARITVTQRPAFAAGERWYPGCWTVQLGPVAVNGAVAHPQCSSWVHDNAVIAIGELLADWRRA